MGSREPLGPLARAYGAGTHRSRVPRCGAGPPVWTGPPAPASRSLRGDNLGPHPGRWRWRVLHGAGAAGGSFSSAALRANWYDHQTTLCKARPTLAWVGPAAGCSTRAHTPRSVASGQPWRPACAHVCASAPKRMAHFRPRPLSRSAPGHRQGDTIGSSPAVGSPPTLQAPLFLQLSLNFETRSQ
jgi:hypothetical protein